VRLHCTKPNEKCIGEEICASIDVGRSWIDYIEGNSGEPDYYREAWVYGDVAYMDGEVCKIVAYDERAGTVTMYCADGDCRGIDGNYLGIFTIPYKQYVGDFGLDW